MIFLELSWCHGSETFIYIYKRKEFIISKQQKDINGDYKDTLPCVWLFGKFGHWIVHCLLCTQWSHWSPWRPRRSAHTPWRGVRGGAERFDDEHSEATGYNLLKLISHLFWRQIIAVLCVVVLFLSEEEGLTEILCAPFTSLWVRVCSDTTTRSNTDSRQQQLSVTANVFFCCWSVSLQPHRLNGIPSCISSSWRSATTPILITLPLNGITMVFRYKVSI